MSNLPTLYCMTIKATSVFERNYNSKKRYVINRGGTRSSKTYSLAQLCVLWLKSWFIEDGWKFYETGVLSIVRKNSTTLKATAMRDFEIALDEFEMRDRVEINKSERSYTFEWRMVEFFGADNEQKLRGSTRNILYCNEANELAWDLEFFQLMIRTTDKIIIDFNPDDEDIWINTELEQKRSIEVGDVEVIVSTYKDNPFLPLWLVQEIERLQTTNPAYWRIYGNGEYGKLEWIIFNNIETVDFIHDDAQFLAYGMDFGYTNDPTSLSAIYMYDGKLIMHELIYARWLTNKDIADTMASLWCDRDADIWADSAEPKSIEEIYQYGWNIKPVLKWPDSIMYGIWLMQQYKLAITRGSMNWIKELRWYVWNKDKHGKSVNKPIDLNNHFIDSVRYACMMSLWKEKTVDLFVW